MLATSPPFRSCPGVADDDEVADWSLGLLKSTSIVCLLIARRAGLQGVFANWFSDALAPESE